MNHGWHLGGAGFALLFLAALAGGGCSAADNGAADAAGADAPLPNAMGSGCPPGCRVNSFDRFGTSCDCPTNAGIVDAGSAVPPPIDAPPPDEPSPDASGSRCPPGCELDKFDRFGTHCICPQDAGIVDAGIVDAGSAVPPPIDVGRVDAPSPIGVTCPSLAGTCVARFFDQVAVCWRPAGTCASGTVIEREWMYTNYRWSNDAAWRRELGDPTGTRLWLQGGRLCMLHSAEGFRSAMDPPPPASPAPRLRIDEATGAVTCPDGSTINVGRDYGGCSVLQRLVRPTCP